MATVPNQEIPAGDSSGPNSFFRQNPDIIFLRLQWQDYSGVLRGRVLTVEHVVASLRQDIPFKASPYALECAADNTVHPVTSHNGMHWLSPDWSSLRRSAVPENATVMCALGYARAGQPPQPDFCPRLALARVVADAQRSRGLGFLVGFEVEFVVAKLSDSPTSATTTTTTGVYRPFGHYAVAGLRDPSFHHVEQCAKFLRAQGVSILAMHTEGIRGQYEFALGPLPPMAAVDQLVLVHGCLKDTLARHGCQVTMAPRPVLGDAKLATGQHMHLSLQPAQPEHEEQAFLAGVLRRLPALCGFCMPLDVSYERLGAYYAGDAVSWGTESRLVPVRKIKACHWELRCVDAAANMYLALAAVLSAGMLGMAGKEPLTWPDLGKAAGGGDDDRVGPFGELLPTKLEAALDKLEADDSGLASALGGPILGHYLKMKRFEMKRLAELDPEMRTSLLNELF